MKKAFVVVFAILFSNIVAGQVITFADPALKSLLVQASSTDSQYFIAGVGDAEIGTFLPIDTNSNGEIEVSEALAITVLYLPMFPDMSGIENFSNLKVLKVTNLATSIPFNLFSSIEVLLLNVAPIINPDFSSVPNLKTIKCSGYQGTTLNLSMLPQLERFECLYGNLTTMDFSQNPQLKFVHLFGNQLTALDFTSNTQLQTLFCSMNNLTSLDLSNCSQLSTLECAINNLTSLNITGTNLYNAVIDSNQLSVVDFTGLNNLNTLSCGGNFFSFIDVSDSTALTSLAVNDCLNLTSVFMKNGSNQYLYAAGSTNLNYVCVDDSEFNQVMNALAADGITCEINTYCSFSPGGNFSLLSGTFNFDANSNGCDSTENVFSQLNLQVTNGTTTSNIITGNSGTYNLALEAGSYTMTPVLENPSYFSVTPTSINVDFPAMTSPVEQNFCITPIGTIYDLEIVLLPLTPARPGFDADYKLVYRNKGNMIQSGTISFDYEDAFTDFISAAPLADGFASGNLQWNFSDLQPFESRNILLTFNINAPTDTPAVIIGDQLDFTATINPIPGDVMPEDNIDAIKQDVVGSFDPNDKTCVEGDSVSPEMIGEYVHYVIRFENTGTYPAENIVVKDMIDTSKFDISTLLPVSASHTYETRISSGNRVEFIFENIMLPFEDTTNDGYIAFKIKTLPSLVVGDTFSNSAAIYFDYNFPIETNTATTTIQQLGTNDFEFSDHFTLYPNPAGSTLNIKSNSAVQLQSASIYNTLGQLVLVTTDASAISGFDVSALKSGNYFIKINSNKGSSSATFIKQ